MQSSQSKLGQVYFNRDSPREWKNLSGYQDKNPQPSKYLRLLATASPRLQVFAFILQSSLLFSAASSLRGLPPVTKTAIVVKTWLAV